MALSTSLAYRTAESPKDFSIWDDHKDILRQLFIEDNKTLVEVKKAMETDYRFPKILRETDYETMLRDRLGFRKYLERPDWLAVGRHLANRKQRGKTSEVFLNGRRLEDRNVHRSVQRYRHKVDKHRVSTPPLPEIIRIRTPPTPSTLVHVTTTRDVQRQSPPLALNGGSLTLGLGPTHQPAYDSVDTLLAMKDTTALSALVTSSYNELRSRVPINQFLSLLLQYRDSLGSLEEMPSPFDTVNTSDGDRSNSSTAFESAGRIPDTPDNFASPCHPPSPRLFGANASLAVLGRSCYVISNGLDCHGEDYRRLLVWIGLSADIAALRVFFSLETPTVCAVWENLIMRSGRFKHARAVRILIEVSLDIKRHSWIQSGQGLCLEAAAHIGFEGAGDLAKRVLDVIEPHHDALSFPTSTYIIGAAASRFDTDMLELFVKAGLHSQGFMDFSLHDVLLHILEKPGRPSPEELKCLDILLEAGLPQAWDNSSFKCKPNILGWFSPGNPVFLTDELFIDSSENSAACYDIFLRHSDRARSWITVDGIIKANEDGVDALRDYVGSHRQPTGVERQMMLELALSEASRRHHMGTVINLLRLGVDPNARRLSEFQTWSWNPMIQATTSLDIKMLELLLENGADMDLFLGHINTQLIIECMPEIRHNRSCYDAVAVVSFMYRFADNSRLSATNQAADIIKLCCHIGYNDHVSSYLHNLASRVHTDLNGMGLLRCAIREGGEHSLHVAKSLIAEGAQVHSIPSPEDGSTMLHDALLANYENRLEMTELLLQHGADCQVDDGGVTILEASLQSRHYHRGRPNNIMETWNAHLESLMLFRRFFALGAPARTRYHRRKVRKWAPLLTLLIANNASYDLIQNVIQAGAVVNEEGEMSLDDEQVSLSRDFGVCSPLLMAIAKKRLNLAVKLISEGSDVHGGLYTPLYTACEYKTPIWFIKLLIDQGAKASAVNPGNGMFPLHMAVYVGSLNVVVLLLDHGADIQAVPKDVPYLPERPLDIAASSGRLDMVHFLLNAGGRSVRPGISGVDYAVEKAKTRGHFAIASVLKEYAHQNRDAILEAETAWIDENIKK